MKKMIASVLLLALVVGGCSGLWANATYSTLIDRTAAASEVTAKKAMVGELTEQQKTDALIAQAMTWRQIKNAKDGKADEQ